jgi:hypothetical protein
MELGREFNTKKSTKVPSKVHELLPEELRAARQKAYSRFYRAATPTDTQPTLNRVNEWRERQALINWIAVTTQPMQLSLEPVPCFRHKPRLSETTLPKDEANLATALLEFLERNRQRAEFFTPPDKPSHLACGDI